MFNFSFTPTIASVVESFNRQLIKLDRVIENHSKHKDEKEDKIADLTYEVTEHENTIDHAQRISTKIKALIN